MDILLLSQWNELRKTFQQLFKYTPHGNKNHFSSSFIYKYMHYNTEYVTIGRYSFLKFKIQLFKVKITTIIAVLNVHVDCTHNTRSICSPSLVLSAIKFVQCLLRFVQIVRTSISFHILFTLLLPPLLSLSFNRKIDAYLCRSLFFFVNQPKSLVPQRVRSAYMIIPFVLDCFFKMRSVDFFIFIFGFIY